MPSFQEVFGASEKPSRMFRGPKHLLTSISKHYEVRTVATLQGTISYNVKRRNPPS